jgi:hypothetical protein
MVLFDNVIQAPDLTGLDGRFPFSVDALDDGQMDAAFVLGNNLRCASDLWLSRSNDG